METSVGTWGKSRLVAKGALVTILALTLSLPMTGCRKMGLDDTPRTMPKNAIPPMGPKRPPMAQQSKSQNTPEATRAAMRGLISPDPAAPASAQQQQPPMQQQAQAPVDQGYNPYMGDNFWANGSGWSANPPQISASAAAPTLQPRPVMMQQPQQQPAPAFPPAPQQQQMSSLPPLSLINPQLAQQQQAYAIPPQAPAFPPAPSYAPQPSMIPQAPQGGDFPKLQEIPSQPYYRSNDEIAADMRDLQYQAQMNPYAMQPQQPVTASPVSLSDANAPYGFSGYGMTPASAPTPAEWAAIPATAPAPQQAPMQFQQPQQQPPQGYYPPESYDAAGFVPPAPIAGVSDIPVNAAQDWDRLAQGNANQGAAYGDGALQLQAPYGSGQQRFLPDSRYAGRVRRAPAQQPQPYGYGY